MALTGLTLTSLHLLSPATRRALDRLYPTYQTITVQGTSVCARAIDGSGSILLVTVLDGGASGCTLPIGLVQRRYYQQPVCPCMIPCSRRAGEECDCGAALPSDPPVHMRVTSRAARVPATRGPASVARYIHRGIPLLSGGDYSVVDVPKVEDGDMSPLGSGALLDW